MSDLRRAAGRRPSVAPGEDRGLTLPELLVTITLLTIVSAAIVASAVAIQRSLGTADATITDMSANRIAIERVGSLLRGATGPQGQLSGTTRGAVLSADASAITFYSVTGRTGDQAPVRVTIAREPDGDLVERVAQPTPDRLGALGSGTLPTYPAVAATPARVIARDIRNADVFRYWTHAQQGADVTSRCGTPLTSLPLDDDDRREVDSVQFRLVLQEERGYESAPSDLQGWARFASSTELGYSSGFESAGCLTDRVPPIRYDDVYTTP